MPYLDFEIFSLFLFCWIFFDEHGPNAYTCDGIGVCFWFNNQSVPSEQKEFQDMIEYFHECQNRNGSLKMSFLM